MNKLTRIMIPFFLCAAVSWAQDVPKAIEPNQTIPSRSLGSQTFQIDLGLAVPLFTSSADGSVTPGSNLTLGGLGRLKWAAFLNSNFSLGVDLSGLFSFGPNQDVLGLVNIGPSVAYTFRAGNFEFPLSFSPALNIMSYKNATYVGFALKPGIGAYFDATPAWSFGLNLSYWWVPELYAGPIPPPSQNRFGNFLEITLSALYSIF